MTNAAGIQTTTRTMTQARAMFLLKTIWPKAPEVEVLKAGILCQQYNLNPLLKQVSLIKFNNKDGTESWVAVLGIKATRNIALNNGHKWSYIDGPRVMTKPEQTTIFGAVDTDKIWAITRIRDNDGNEYPGYGFWPHGANVYGSDKGNSPINMAFIRSERNALDKMGPGELPNAEAMDETYSPVDMDKALAVGKQEATEIAKKDIAELWGPS